MIKRLLPTLLTVLLLAALFAGCSGGTPQTETSSAAATQETTQTQAPVEQSADTSATAAADDITIGFVQIDLTNTFHIGEVEGAKECARRYGFNIEVTSGDGDVTKQVEAFDNLIEKGVDAIAVNPIDVTAYTNSFEKAKAKGIPVIIEHSSSDYATCEVGFDEFSLSSEVGEYAVKLLTDKYGSAKGNVAILAGMLGQGLNQGRTGGFISVMDKNPDIKIVAAEPTDWDGTKATTIMENYLTTYPDIDLLYGLSDSVTYPAANVIMNANKRDQIFITSVDGMDYALKAIQDGEMDSTYLLGSQYTGYWKCFITYQAATGKLTEKKHIINGCIVTKDNVDTVVKMVDDMKNNIQTFQFERELLDILKGYK